MNSKKQMKNLNDIKMLYKILFLNVILLLSNIKCSFKKCCFLM